MICQSIEAAEVGAPSQDIVDETRRESLMTDNWILERSRSFKLDDSQRTARMVERSRSFKGGAPP